MDSRGNFWSEFADYFTQLMNEYGGYFAAAGVVSQVDSPMIGPADVVAGGMALGGLLIVTGVAIYEAYNSIDIVSHSTIITETDTNAEAIYGPPEPPKGLTYFHSTTLDNATKIMGSGIMQGSKWEGGYVYAWRSKPSNEAVKNCGARHGVLISFKTNAAFELDQGVNFSYRIYGPIKSSNRGPIAVWDVQIVEVYK